MTPKSIIFEDNDELKQSVPEDAAVMLIGIEDFELDKNIALREEIAPEDMSKHHLAKLSLKAQSFQKAHVDEQPVIIIHDLAKIIDNVGLSHTVSFLKLVINGDGLVLATEGSAFEKPVQDTIEPLFDTAPNRA